MTSTHRPTRSRSVRVVTIGLATSGLCLAGAGLAAAAAPGSAFASALEGAADAVGIDWSAMPEGYTPEQYQAFWAADYTAEDLAALEELWSLDSTETKAHAGQLLLDGQELPFAPGTHGTPPLSADAEAAVAAFFAAGYTTDDAAALAALWSTDALETKAHAGELLLTGQTVPVTPSGTPGTAAATSGVEDAPAARG